MAAGSREHAAAFFVRIFVGTRITLSSGAVRCGEIDNVISRFVLLQIIVLATRILTESRVPPHMRVAFGRNSLLSSFAAPVSPFPGPPSRTGLK